MSRLPLLAVNAHGLYCAAGDFYIDPQRRVERAVITHAHADHARAGCRSYLTSATGARLLRERLGGRMSIEPVGFGRAVRIGDVNVSLHPAGHILGSAQVRVEHRGAVWVVSGDYKTERDAACEPFEPVRCHTFITEATFAQAFYRWRPQSEVFAEINAWWRANAGCGRLSVVGAYVLGKAQRILAGLNPSIGPICVDRSVAQFLPAYAAAGIKLPRTQHKQAAGALLVTPHPVATGAATAFASGWMLRRGAARRFGVERGFVLSDHADWDGIIATIRATGAERVGVTHGDARELLRWLRAHRLEGWALPARKPTRGQLELSLD